MLIKFTQRDGFGSSIEFIERRGSDGADVDAVSYTHLPFTLTCKAVDNEKYQALLANETRYSRLTRAFPDRAKELFARNQEVANDRYEHLTRLVDLYK